MKRLALAIAAFLPALALMVGVFSVNTACFSYFHQLETPNEMNAYRK